MSSNTWISVGVGVLTAAVVVFSGGTAAAALFAFSLGATATSLVLGPGDTGQKSGLRPDEFQMNQSSEDITIPVIFGTSRVSPNYIFVGFDDFESKEIYTEQKGGKGGGGEKQLSGYTYTVPLSYGICMGPIDRLRRVISSPGLDLWKEFAGAGLDFPSNAETFDLIYTKTGNGQTYKEGGSCKFYPGSEGQGSGAATTDTNHRFFCWVDFPKYEMTGNPAPRTLLFEITRMPKVLDDYGNEILGFPKRGSKNPADPEWLDANPAAVAWEILQNPVWGKGARMADLDVDTFKTAANYYAESRLGISTAMGKTTLSEFMGRLRDIFGLWVWWDGSKMRCRCIYDRTGAYSPRTILTAQDVVDSPQFSRASLSGTFNEIRLEFTNRESNWAGEVATAMDLAHVETVQGVRTQTVDAGEIGTRRAAELIAHAMLRQMAYPGATCVVRLRRTYSGLQPGSFVQFEWDEWRDTGTATTFWRVISVVDDDQGSEGLTVTLAEDLYATARDGAVGEDEEWEDPYSTIDDDEPLQNSDLDDGNLFGDRQAGTITPVVMLEPNSWATGMKRAILVMPTREKKYVASVGLAWRKYGASKTTPLGSGRAFPYNGTLLDAIPADGPLTSRGVAEFRVQLYNAADATKVEAATGLVQFPADHFAELLDLLQAVLVIEGEIFRVGFAEVTAPGVVTVRTYVRAELGSVKALHSIGATACFFPTFATSAFTPADGIPTTDKVVVTLKPVISVSSNVTEESIATVEAPADGLGIRFAGASVAPLPPELVDATRVGTTWTVRIRPRVWFGGAGYRNELADDLTNYVTSLTGLALAVSKASGSVKPTVPAGTNFSTPPFAMPSGTSIDSLAWKPDDGGLNGGIITLVVTFDANPATMRIWGVRDGYESTTPLTIPTP